MLSAFIITIIADWLADGSQSCEVNVLDFGEGEECGMATKSLLSLKLDLSRLYSKKIIMAVSPKLVFSLLD